jgi:hypothetical protein
MFMGAFGALNYVFAGFVDLRLTMLLYAGSLFGIYVGAYGTKVVREVVIRLVTSLVILICVLSRGVAVPIYLRQLGFVEMDPTWDLRFNMISKFLLMAAGVAGVGVIIYNVAVAFRRQRQVRRRLATAVAATAPRV